MFYKKIVSLLFLCIVVSCSNSSGGDVETIADRHQEKLRRHFSSGDTSVDISTLISETRSISMGLKNAGLKDRANKFDSYTDVLMFGNNTVDESINDVISLIGQGHNQQGYKRGGCDCPTFKGFFSRIFN